MAVCSNGGENLNNDRNSATVTDDLDIIVDARVRLRGMKNEMTEVDVFIPQLNRDVHIRIPNIVEQGQSIRIIGKGHTGARNAKGNLIVNLIHVEYYDMEITTSVTLSGKLDAISRVPIFIPHLNKTIQASIPNNTTVEDTIRLKGLGLNAPNDETGDLYVHFDHVEYSETSNDCVREDGEALEGRSTSFAGKVYKCPQCGEVLQSFVAACPLCGYELRGSKAADSIREFSARFAKASSLKNKIDLITTYAIPNTVEDVREFLILALANIEVAPGMTEEDIKLANAWVSKYEQAYQKAKLLFTDTAALEAINDEFCNKKKHFQSAKRRWDIGCFLANNKKLVRIIAIVLAGIIGTVIVTWPIYGQPWVEDRKLEKLVKQVERHIEVEEYDQAWVKANQIIYDSSDFHQYARKQKWDDIRHALLEEIEEKRNIAEGKKQIGKSSDELLEMNYQDVVNYLSEKGFTNIEAKPLKKGFLGWFTDDGKVETITIGGNNEFEADAWYDAASKIIVTYYARKE